MTDDSVRDVTLYQGFETAMKRHVDAIISALEKMPAKYRGSCWVRAVWLQQQIHALCKLSETHHLERRP